MQLASELPFELGETVKGTDVDGNIVTPDWAGKKFLLADSNMASSRTSPRLSGRQLVGVPILNNSGVTLLGKRFARLKRAGGRDDNTRVDGYSAALAEKRLVFIDEFLATSGVADKYYFWGILVGPVTALTPMVDADFNADIAVGAELVSATAVTTQATSGGRVSNLAFPAATSGVTTATFEAFKMAARLVGTALSARTSAETNSNILIDLCMRW